MGIPWYRSHRSAAYVALFLLTLVAAIICLWPVNKDVTLFSDAQEPPMKKKASSPVSDLEPALEQASMPNRNKKATSPVSDHESAIGQTPMPYRNKKATSPVSDLESALEQASMPNRTVILTMLNKAYSEADGLLHLFLRGFREGENTEHLINHILFLTVDQVSYYQCLDLDLHCYKINMDGGDMSEEVLYMTNSFIDMMWARTHMLSKVLRLGYSFIFTDMDILWLRNPFTNLKRQGEDMLLSCDGYNGLPYDDRNAINTGFFVVTSNNKTISLLDKWSAARNNSKGMKEQDVLNHLKSKGEFHRLGMLVRYLDLEHFSGMCQTMYNAKKVTTVHANCCRTMKAKVSDLTAMLEAWRTLNKTSEVVWPRHKACHDSWKVSSPEDDELEIALRFLSRENKTVTITIINKSHTEKDGLLDIFLRGLRGSRETDYLIDRILFVAVDQVALSRCTEMRLNCYKLEMSSSNLTRGMVIKKDGFVDHMWIKSYFIRRVLKRGYNVIFTDIDVLWLRNPLKILNRKGEDMSFSCDTYNGQAFDNSNSISTGLYFVASNNKTKTFFNKWYMARKDSELTTEKDALNYLKTEGLFSKLNMKVRYLDTGHFCGFCQTMCNVKKVITVQANCCGTKQAKTSDLTAVLNMWLRSNGRLSAEWPKHKACLASLKMPDELLEP